MVPLRGVPKQILVGMDQWLNTVCFGYADETLSARAYRTRNTYWGRVAYRSINGIFFWQKNHCMAAYAMEMFRQHLPEVYRESCKEK